MQQAKAASKRLKPEVRKQQLLDAGYAMAEKDGLGAVNRVQLGNACGVSDGLVSKYFGSAPGMHAAILELAKRNSNVAVLADGLEMGTLKLNELSRPLANAVRAERDRREA